MNMSSTGNKDKILTKSLKEDLENLERYIEEFSVFLPLPVYTLNPSGLIVDVNWAGKKISGYNESVLIGQEIEFLFKDRELIRQFFEATISQGVTRDQEMIMLTKGNRQIVVKVSSGIRKDEQGHIIGCFMAVSDISKIKKFQERLEQKVKERTRALEEEKNKTKAILFSLTDGLVVFDSNKKINLINPEAKRILEVEEKDVLNKKINQLTVYPNFNKLYQIFNKKLEWTGQKYELILDKPIERFFQVSINPFVAGQKEIGLMVVLHDITREKEIDRMKTEFVSIAAHQLRTPLSAIKWTFRMLLDGDIGSLSAEQVDFLKKGYQSNERMIKLINELLNVARIEEGRFVYGLTSESLPSIIKEVIQENKNLAAKKKIKIIFKRPKETLPKINLDKEKINLVLQNLLDNAIRFNKTNGRVTISLKRDKMDLEVIIKDNGVGIPANQQNKIFTKFFRANNAIKLETEGTGLGLFICRNIIEAHGGQIWFESKKGQGTTFKFTLPIKQ